MFVRQVSMAEGQRLQRIRRTAKDPVQLRAIVVLMSAQGQPAPDIAHLLKVTEDYVRDVIHAFNERGFDALDPKWSGDALPAEDPHPTPPDRPLLPRARGVTADALGTTVVWVGGALSAGVLGNAAYDLLKAAASRLLRRGSPKVLSQPQAVQIARRALQERVAQAEIDNFPEVEVLEVAEWSLSERGWRILLQGPEVLASVEIPAASERRDAVKAVVSVTFSGRAAGPRGSKFMPGNRAARPGPDARRQPPGHQE
ncbi:helix-turn-helix domain-containing protein [Micromonospora sp. NPDC048063]|uniref:helix-turn-helix domain-containing protein n=1 Tax=Micromonospora sp. NPDC048063 TaxID=3364256 RepID=UPI003712D8A8